MAKILDSVNKYFWLIAVIIIVALIVWLFNFSATAPDNKASVNPAEPTPSAAEQKALENYGNISLSFQENKGQVDAEVKYLVRTGSTSIFFTDTEVVYSIVEQKKSDNKGPRRGSPVEFGEGEKEEQEPSKGVVIRQKFSGANNSPSIVGENELEGKINYFVGNKEDEWVKEARTFSGIRYKDLFDGIDLAYSGSNAGMSFEYSIAAGEDPGQIEMTVEGTEGMTIAADGALVFETNIGNIGTPKPSAYQVVDGEEVEVSAEYVISDGENYSFKLGDYDDSLPISIRN